MNTLMLRRFARRPFVRNVATLTSGQAIAQALTIAASPILTRLYDPDAFGSFGLLISLSAPLVGISALRYELAVVTARDDTTAANLLVLSCGIVLLVSGLSAALAGLAGDWIAVLVERPDFGALLWWLPVLVLMGGMYQTFTYWSTRRTHYKRLAVSKVLQSLATLGAQITAGLANLGSAGLAGGRVCGPFMAASFLAIQMWRDDRSLIRSAMTVPGILKAAKENSGFPKYNAPQNLINSLSRASIPYTLAPFFGVEIVGFYYLAERVLRTPSILVTGSIRTVFYQRASELHNQGKSFYRLLISTFAALFSMGITPLILLLFFGPEIFTIVFGAEWHRAGIFTQWLANWWFLAFVAGPAVETLTILQLQKYLLLFQIAFSAVRIISILAGAMVGDDITAIAACSIVGVVFNFALIVAVLLIVRQRSKSEGERDDG
ncbi:MAG: oligosaccharide flippase family protein [Nitrososphaera sp.]|nr:oligosaccharide flippase family protein [Nitrososphaera sp.]